MRLRRRPARDADGSKVPDGPPERGPWCDKDCDTRWDNPHHSAACDERVDARLREFDRQMRAYWDYRDKLSGRRPLRDHEPTDVEAWFEVDH